MQYIIIPNGPDHSDEYPIDTLEQIEEAQEALRDAGLSCAEVWAGEGEDAIRNGGIVWAAPEPTKWTEEGYWHATAGDRSAKGLAREFGVTKDTVETFFERAEKAALDAGGLTEMPPEWERYRERAIEYTRHQLAQLEAEESE